jgi:transcriptional regulator with XRE-family HTH domain
MTNVDVESVWVERLLRAERRRSGVSTVLARRRVARKLGVAPGTIENIQRGRSKGLRGWVIERIRAAVIEALNQEIAGAQHELELARQSRGGPCTPEIAAVEAAVEQARRLLKGE